MASLKHKSIHIAVVTVVLMTANWLGTPFLISSHRHLWCGDHHQFEDAEAHMDGDGREGLVVDSHVPVASMQPWSALSSAIPRSEPYAHARCRIIDQLHRLSYLEDGSQTAGLPRLMAGRLPITGGGAVPSPATTSFAPKNSPPT